MEEEIKFIVMEDLRKVSSFGDFNDRQRGREKKKMNMIGNNLNWSFGRMNETRQFEAPRCCCDVDLVSCRCCCVVEAVVL